ncbi:cystathionine gamma-synthase [Candidatus Peregrinibacteria bacterium RIFOXYC2_FULL_33_13]|nr:MAG: Cystathionine beta-lyase [Candidatus Peregrinibacteria bacterium GW2011_GWA2_33_10]KKP40842.1 MAG: cystathionine beta-lyase, cystathionine beta-lyase [Candidatus Peregrinibacteria bacterium GW2011_GWC2_33_13]OGJ55672.1 MAG: cystathionine gamma-synthase [Candidatus Peregrinibacteria bacterium RIFOXYC2_FULL_33_13]
MRFSTKAIHVGQNPDKTTGAIIPPIYLTSTYVQEAPNQHNGYDYTRAGNPNYTNLEQTLASLEEGAYATVFSSGLGAITALISILKKDDLVLAGNDLYGGTFRLFNNIFSNFGVNLKIIDTQNIQEVENSMKLKPKAIFLETPSNPLLKITDIQTINKIAKKYYVLTFVDNTFATPYFQKPLNLGADAIIHSTTKYIGGHSDIIGGVVITNNEKIKEKIDFARKAIGLNPSPFDCWLISRGIKTLALRMEKHFQNAFKIAKFLESHKKVKKVHYPGLPSHSQHQLAKKQMNGFGGIVSVEFDLTLEQTKKLISNFKLFSLAESLGGVESLVDHPASMTHASISKEEREKNGLKDSLIRFSIGIEDEKDLIEDLCEGIDQIIFSK